MDYRPLDITVISATGLENFLFFFKMRVFVVVSLINGNSVIEKKTHSTLGPNPKWNHRLKFPVEESAIQTTTLLFVFRQHRIFGAKDIGEVSIPVRELLDTNPNSGTTERVVDYQVQSMRGKSVGTFTFSHQFSVQARETLNSSHPPAAPYMANQQGMIGYPPQAGYSPAPGYVNYPGGQYGGGWYPSATPPGGYPYQPQQVGYNHPKS